METTNQTSEFLTSFNPSTGEILGQLPISGASDIHNTVSNAQQAAKQWKSLPIGDRVRRIKAAYAHIKPHVNQLSELLSKEMGKDLRRAMGEVEGAIFSAGYYADSAQKALSSKSLGSGTTLHYKALGVVAVISPWNYPIMMANNLIVPALVAGNTVVLKPSEETPLIAQAFFEHLKTHLPDGVFDIVHGDAATGKTLVESDVQLIAFTGSQKAGKDIMAHAATQLKRLVMELGGNDPMIVMADADIEQAARFAVASSFENAGQMCTSTERIYVDDAIAERFEQRVVQIASQYQVGSWNEPNVNIGPIINTKQHQNILAHIKDAQEKGARILLGHAEYAAPFIQPTVIADLSPDMVMSQAETFGPIVAIGRYKNIEDAIALANDSNYGLGAAVFGYKNVDAIATQLEAGMIGINQGPGGSGDAPWVGAKQSGFGFHGSAEGHRQFAQTTVVGK